MRKKLGYKKNMCKVDMSAVNTRYEGKKRVEGVFHVAANAYLEIKSNKFCTQEMLFTTNV